MQTDPPALTWTLVPREPRFAVRLPNRLPRAGTEPLQIPLPRVFHAHLRDVVSGSLNHALIALVRLAFHWLDADGVRLVINPLEDPLNQARLGTDRRPVPLDPLWLTHPHLYSEEPRDKITVELRGRPARTAMVFLQVGIPHDLRTRLVEEGTGSIGQQFAYLARYALMRLEMTQQSLHVEAGDESATTVPSPATTKQSRLSFPIETVADLRQHLGGLPEHWLIRMVDVDEEDGRIYGLVINPYINEGAEDDAEMSDTIDMAEVWLFGDPDFEAFIEMNSLDGEEA